MTFRLSTLQAAIVRRTFPFLLAALCASPIYAQRATSTQPDPQSPARLQRTEPASATAPNLQPSSEAPIGKTDQRTFATFPRTYTKAFGPNQIDRSTNPGQSQRGQAYNVKPRNAPRANPAP